MNALIDPRFWDHPKARKCSLEAKALWLCGLLYAVRHKTDEVDESVLKAEHADAHIFAAELVDAGLWTYTDHGWRIHDYYRWYPATERRDELGDAVRRGMGIAESDWGRNYGRALTDAHLRADIDPDEVENITRWLVGQWRSKPNGPTGAPKFDTILASRPAYHAQALAPKSKADLFKRLAGINDTTGNGPDSGPALHRLAAAGD